MKKLRYLIVPALAVYGFFMSRFHGGGFKGGVSKLLKAFLWSAPFSIGSGAALWFVRERVTDFLQNHFEVFARPPFDAALLDWAVPVTGALLVLILCMVFKNTGHGGGMDLAHNTKAPGVDRDPEKLEYLILWLYGKIPTYWYDALLLSIIGVFSTLGPAIALGVCNPLAAVPVVMGGAAKSVGYMIGWTVHPIAKKGDGNFDEATEVGEALTGLFAYVGFATGLLIVFLN